MDRPIVYTNEALRSTDFLLASKGAMVGLARLCEAMLGTSTVVDGLPCSPASGLNVSVGPGSIYFNAQTDPTAYGSLALDTALIQKQGIRSTSSNFACPAPGTAGQSINYLIEAQFQENDTGNTSLPFYNSANPSVPQYANNNTLRQDLCAVQVKAGTAAATGSQTTPANTSGWTPLWVITVAYGASSISAGNITVHPSAPFIPMRLQVLGMLLTAQTDVSGTPNTITVNSNPPLPGYFTGFSGMVIAANTNTGPVTVNWSGNGNKSLVNPDGSALAAGAVVAGRTIAFTQNAAGNLVYRNGPWVATRSAGDNSNFAASTAYTDAAAATALASALSAISTAQASNLFVWQAQRI